MSVDDNDASISGKLPHPPTTHIPAFFSPPRGCYFDLIAPWIKDLSDCSARALRAELQVRVNGQVPTLSHLYRFISAHQCDGGSH
jgi:hypothetical protein